jgi:hypothetical protein
VLLGSGGGSFSAALNFGVGIGSRPVHVAISDLNGDTLPDLAIANGGGGADEEICKARGGPSGSVSVLLGDGSGNFVFGSSYGLLNDPCAVVPVNLNGDSKVDLAVPNARTRVVSVLLNRTP